MLFVKLFVCFVMMFGVLTASAKNPDCMWCGASTHTSDHCNVHRPDGSTKGSLRTSSKELVLTNGRWTDKSDPAPPLETPVCANCGGSHSTMNCMNPRRSLTPPQNAPSSAPAQAVGVNPDYERERAAWNEKKRLEAVARNQSQAIRNAGQELAVLKAQNEELEKQKVELEAKAKALEQKVQELTAQATWYEKYARSLHKQIGFNPEDFKVFRK